VSVRQRERASRFAEKIEIDVRSAARKFRDNDPAASVSAVLHLWWSTQLRGRTFAALVREATTITSGRVSVGAVKRGEPGHREAMPYFHAVLRDLAGSAQRRRRRQACSVANIAGASPPPGSAGSC